MSFQDLFPGPSTLVFIGALISAAGGFLATREQARSERELRIKAEEIAGLNRTIADTITGGETFAYLEVDHPAAGSETADLLLLTDGKYPLYDVSVRIQDVDQFTEKMRQVVTDQSEEHGEHYSLLDSIRLMQSASFERSLGNLSPNLGVPFGKVDLSGRRDALFRVTIIARNGTVIQDIKFKRDGDRWVWGDRVTRGDKVLLSRDEGHLLVD